MSNGYGGSSGYSNGTRGGYNGGSGGGGPPQRSQENSVFVGGLGDIS